MPSSRTRKLDDWLDAFTARQVAKGNPKLFAQWTAVSIIAGAMERKVFIPTQEGNLFANHYIMLVGRPGTGKSRQVVPARELWTAAGRINVGPASTTGAALLDKLKDAKTQYKVGRKTIVAHALSFASAEWSTFIRQYDSDVKGRLTELYDGGKFQESIRKREADIVLENIFLNVLLATQPAALATQITPEEWDTGLSSRIIFVFNTDPPPPTNPHAINTASTEDLKNLVHDLRRIYDMKGELRKAPDYIEADWNWIQSGHAPAPTHHKLESGYNSRRWVHLAKLTMVLAVSRGSRIIELADWQRAKKLLEETEAAMPAMFTQIMSLGGLAPLAQDAEVMLRRHMVAGKAYSEKRVHRLLTGLGNTRNLRSVTNLIEHLHNSGTVSIKGGDRPGCRTVTLANEGACIAPEEGNPDD